MLLYINNDIDLFASKIIVNCIILLYDDAIKMALNKLLKEDKIIKISGGRYT